MKEISSYRCGRKNLDFSSSKGAKHLFCQNIFGKWDKDDVELACKFVPYLFMPHKVHMPLEYVVSPLANTREIPNHLF